MRVLVIAERIPGRIGGNVRQFNLIRELSKKHEFSVVAYAYPVDLHNLDDLQPYACRIETIQLPVPVQEERRRLYWWLNGWQHALLDPYPKRGRYPLASKLREKIDAILREQPVDIVFVNQAYLARFLPSTNAATILDMQDILSEYERLVMMAKTKITHRFQAWLEWKKMQALERQAVREFDVCVTISEEDKARLLEQIPDANVAMVTNGVDLEYFRPKPDTSEGTGLVFVGSMHYTPNRDAVLYFYRDILPLVKKYRPEVHLSVVGWGPPPEILALNNDPHVTVTGLVEDVRPYIADSQVAIVPLRFGSGVRNKILEAWAMAKPVVSTSLGAEGLAVRPGENILLGDDPERFARSVLSLLDDREQRVRLGQHGRQLVESKYSWKAIGQQMNAVYEKSTRRRREIHTH